jgi:hypothetical protein
MCVPGHAGRDVRPPVPFPTISMLVLSVRLSKDGSPQFLIGLICGRVCPPDRAAPRLRSPGRCACRPGGPAARLDPRRCGARIRLVNSTIRPCWLHWRAPPMPNTGLAKRNWRKRRGGTQASASARQYAHRPGIRPRPLPFPLPPPRKSDLRWGRRRVGLAQGSSPCGAMGP